MILLRGFLYVSNMLKFQMALCKVENLEMGRTRFLVFPMFLLGVVGVSLLYSVLLLLSVHWCLASVLVDAERRRRRAEPQNLNEARLSGL